MESALQWEAKQLFGNPSGLPHGLAPSPKLPQLIGLKTTRPVLDPFPTCVDHCVTWLVMTQAGYYGKAEAQPDDGVVTKLSTNANNNIRNGQSQRNTQVTMHVIAVSLILRLSLFAGRGQIVCERLNVAHSFNHFQ